MTKRLAKKKRSALQRIAFLVGLGLVSAAVIKELSLPRKERTWHGAVLHVPYDFRPPTVERIRAHVVAGRRALADATGVRCRLDSQPRAARLGADVTA